MKLTKAQHRTLVLVRDTGWPYEGTYRHNSKQWEMWDRLQKLGLIERPARRYRITSKGRAVLREATT